MRTLRYLLFLGSLLVPTAAFAGDPGLQARQRPPDHEQVKREFPEKRHETPTLQPGIQTGQKKETPPAVQPRAGQQPPQRVWTNRPETLKQERRLVKEQDASVFRQQSPENLPVKRSSELRVIIRTPPKQPAEQKNMKDRGENRDGR
jgi:hypothetical protein